MNFAITVLLIGLLSVRELLRAYHGSEFQPGRQMRWLNYAILITLVFFIFVIARQVVFLVTMP